MEIVFECVSDSSPNWFDWASLIVSVLAIGVAYWLGNRQYKAEKKKEAKNIKSEKKLFYDNLIYLQKTIEKQIDELKDYKVNFKYSINASIGIDFLKYVDVKSLYKGNNRNDVNRLLSTLYQLYGVNKSLNNEVKIFRNFYYKKEKKFEDYHNHIFYDFYNSLAGHRAENFKDDDAFMENFRSIKKEYVHYMGSSGTKENIQIQYFLKLLYEKITPEVPQNPYATSLETKISKTSLLFYRMEEFKDIHLKKIDEFIDLLSTKLDRIKEYEYLFKY